MKTILAACSLLLLIVPFSAAGGDYSSTHGPNTGPLQKALDNIKASKGPADSAGLTGQILLLGQSVNLPKDGPADLTVTATRETSSVDSMGGNPTTTVVIEHYSIHLVMKDGKIAQMSATLSKQSASASGHKQMGLMDEALKAKPVQVSSWALNMPEPAGDRESGSKAIPSETTPPTTTGSQPSPLQERSCGGTVSPSSPGCQ